MNLSNKDELLATSLTRNGKLGEICYCHDAYCHDLRNEITEVALCLKIGKRLGKNS